MEWMMKGRALKCAVLILVATLGSLASAAEWPQEVVTEEGSIFVYQPQPEKLEGNLLSGRAAMSLELKGSDDPIFGAMWFEATLDTDKEADTVIVRDLKVTRVVWPDSRDAGEQRFTHFVESSMPDTGFEISLDRLTASLDSAQIERRSLADLKTDPPIIDFRESLAVLLLYDGEPRFSNVDGSDYERALNTTFVVVRNQRTKTLYLTSGSFWYQAKDPMGPWTPSDTPPADLVAMLPKPDTTDVAPAAQPPEIVAADQPTELIATDGKPEWTPLTGGALLYVANTETPWLREIATGNMYLLLSGRWYRSKQNAGPWTFVPADELPRSFSDIPPASDIGGLRASVAGTDEANAAVASTAIPQTAAIKRSEATLSVEYDGAPKFEKIPGTSVSYAVNTGAQVLEVKERFYAVDNGVWFTAAVATGPWQVADSIPNEEISRIPPSSPAYNTTYVKIYQSTPEIIYVGYTPGYLWSFPYYGVPVYGTGWYYPPYWGTWYYPRPPTWGLHVGYNPWTGWNYGVSWSNGFFTFGMSWGGGWGGAYRPWGCCGGWYGGGYRGPVVINTGDINIGNNINIGNRTNISNRIGNDTRIGSNRLEQTNLYKQPENRGRNADAGLARSTLRSARPATDRANNLYAGKDGTVARRTGDAWESRTGGAWKPETKAAVQSRATNIDRSAVRDQAAARVDQGSFKSTGFDRSGFERAHQQRQFGGMRERGRMGGGRRR